MRRLAGAALLVLSIPAVGLGQAPTGLRVATREVKPFVFEEGGQSDGIQHRAVAGNQPSDERQIRVHRQTDGPGPSRQREIERSDAGHRRDLHHGRARDGTRSVATDVRRRTADPDADPGTAPAAARGDHRRRTLLDGVADPRDRPADHRADRASCVVLRETPSGRPAGAPVVLSRHSRGLLVGGLDAGHAGGPDAAHARWQESRR